eukprot:Lithocolla_globosa_v1_NODE_53_length_7694_cov_9.633984.p6 type:complete len:123 gc:universal NODE_53_length_7694_cov_9.633984:6505-6873(+)
MATRTIVLTRPPISVPRIHGKVWLTRITSGFMLLNWRYQRTKLTRLYFVTGQYNLNCRWKFVGSLISKKHSRNENGRKSGKTVGNTRNQRLLLLKRMLIQEIIARVAVISSTRGLETIMRET